MAAPLRKPRKSAASQPAGEKRRFVIRLSGPMATLLATILAVAVGWSFFMGFMVGRGQNPETRVEQMTSMMSKDSAPGKGKPAQQEAPAPSPGRRCGRRARTRSGNARPTRGRPRQSCQCRVHRSRVPPDPKTKRAEPRGFHSQS